MREQTKQLYSQIKAEFLKLSEVKQFGVKKYTNAWIFNKLATDFYKSPKTIENIVFDRTNQKSQKPV